MTVIGLTIGEIAALIGILSFLGAGGARFYSVFRQHITAPLIEALDKLTVEISQLEHYLEGEYQELNRAVDQLSDRLLEMEERHHDWEQGRYEDDYRVINQG